MCKIIFTAFLALLAACSSQHISISQQRIDRDYLASSHVHTPDPRQENPPFGQMLIVDWSVPRSILKKHPQIILYLIYRNFTEEVFYYPITSGGGHKLFFLINKEYEEKKGILTYKAEIVTDDNQVYSEWRHQMWVNLITLQENEPTEAISSSVVDQSIQGSVIETALPASK